MKQSHLTEYLWQSAARTRQAAGGSGSGGRIVLGRWEDVQSAHAAGGYYATRIYDKKGGESVKRSKRNTQPPMLKKR